MEPKKHPPVNVETIAPVSAGLGLLKSPRKVLNVRTEEMMPLNESSPVSVSVLDIEQKGLSVAHLSYLRNGDVRGRRSSGWRRIKVEDVKNTHPNKNDPMARQKE